MQSPKRQVFGESTDIQRWCGFLGTSLKPPSSKTSVGFLKLAFLDPRNTEKLIKGAQFMFPQLAGA